jgi:PAS domain-containing protein
MQSTHDPRAQTTLTEKRLRESDERYRAFIANSSEGIWR